MSQDDSLAGDGSSLSRIAMLERVLRQTDEMIWLASMVEFDPLRERLELVRREAKRLFRIVCDEKG